ncbi:hemolysin family protein [Actibacterium pelagium]|nr:hemolysin family protein [Actibacterium pelagium]
MNSEADGSSIAAQSAQSESEQNATGLLKRLRHKFSGTPQTDPEEAAPEPVAGQPQPLGMGNLHRMRVEDVAIPKVEIVSVPGEIGKEELVNVFRESGMSRLPVFDGTLDTPLGMIHLKDFALKHGFNGKGSKFDVTVMLRPLLYVPPSMPIGVLLQKMQKERMHMALVIDEYGGVDGLVTIEDLIEQVIGEIEDEHDVDEALTWIREKSGSYLVQAKTPLDEFEAETGIKLAEDEDEDIDTLGGLVFVMVGRVPVRGEIIPHPAGAQFEILDADPRRIKRMRVRFPKEMDPKSGAADS